MTTRMETKIATRFEIRKILSLPALWGFVAVVLIINIAYAVTTSDRKTIDYINDVSGTTGTSFGAAYAEKMSALPLPEGEQLTWIHGNLTSAAETSTRDIFEDITAAQLYKENQDFIFDNKKISPTALALLKLKYEKLEPVIREKAANDDSLSVYFSGETYRIHNRIFNDFGKLFLAESGILSILIMLYLLDYETLCGTSDLVFSAKRGRRILTDKFRAGIAVGVGLFLLIFGTGYAVLFLTNDFSVVWHENVSSLQNVIQGAVFKKPFITWERMNVGTYFWASAGLSLLVNCLFSVIGAVCGIFFRHVLTAAAVALGSFVMNFFIISYLDWSNFLFYLLRLTPFGLLYEKGRWFTDGNDLIFLPRFETVLALFYIALFAGLTLLAMKRFNRKDLL